MQKQEKGLPKVTKSLRKTPATVKKKAVIKSQSSFQLQLRDTADTGVVLRPEEKEALTEILHGPKFTQKKFDKLSRAEKEIMSKLFTLGLNTLAFEDLDMLIEKIENVTVSETRRQLWEMNHFRIMKAIDSLTRKNNRFPTRGEIQNVTSLSRKTIHKHLSEYFTSSAYQERKDELFALRDKALQIRN